MARNSAAATDRGQLGSAAHGAVQLVFETGKPIAQVARDLGINEGTLGNWCAGERRKRQNGNAALSEDERAELVRLYRGGHRAADAA